MRPGSRAPLVGAAFAVLLAVGAAAFLSLRLWEQPLWTVAGAHRFLYTAAATAALAAILFPVRSLLVAALLAALGFAYSIAAVGAGAAFGVLYWLAGVWCLGRLVLRRWRVEARGGSLPALLLELPVGLAVLSLGMGLTAWLPIHRPWVHLLWPALCIAAEARALPAGLRRLRSVAWLERSPASSYLACVLVGFLIFANWQAALMPEISADGLSMHLGIAAWMAAHGSFHFDVTRAVWAVMPMSGDWLFASAYLVGGEAAAKLANLAFLLLLAGLTYSITRRWTSRALALLAVALFLSTPVTHEVTGSLFVENAWTLFLLSAVAAIERWQETGDRRWLPVAAALAGSAVAGKFGAVVCLLALAAGVALALRGGRRLRGGLLAAGIVFLLFALPPYVQAMARTGNPVFPYLNNVFRSPLFDASRAFRDPRYPGYLRPDLLYRMTFHSRQFLEGFDGSLGFHLFVLWPVALAALRRKMPLWATVAAAAAPLMVLLVFSSLAYLRYVYPIYVLVAVLVGWLLGEARRASVWLGRALTAGAVVCVIGNSWFLASAGWYNRDFALNLALDPAERERFLAVNAPQRLLIQYLNRSAPGQPAAFLEGSETAGFAGRAYTNTWHNSDFVAMLSRVQTAPELAQELDRRGIRYVVAAVEDDHFVAPYSVAEVLLGDCGQNMRQVGALAVVKLSPACGPAFVGSLHQLPAPPGAYDDRSLRILYIGNWMHDHQFREAARGTVTYINRPGSAFEFHFEGAEVTWVFTRAFNRGKARVLVDGEQVAVVDLYSRQTAWQQRQVFRARGAGPHLLRVEVLPAKNPAATDTFVDVDLLVAGPPR